VSWDDSFVDGQQTVTRPSWPTSRRPLASGAVLGDLPYGLDHKEVPLIWSLTGSRVSLSG